MFARLSEKNMLNIISSSRYKIDRASIQKQVEQILSSYPIPPQSVLNIVFVGKKKMGEYSKKYKSEDVALPVLSFSYLERHSFSEGAFQPEENVIGEIIICYPQAVLLAAEREKKVDYIIAFLVEHGVKNILQ